MNHWECLVQHFKLDRSVDSVVLIVQVLSRVSVYECNQTIGSLHPVRRNIIEYNPRTPGVRWPTEPVNSGSRMSSYVKLYLPNVTTFRKMVTISSPTLRFERNPFPSCFPNPVLPTGPSPRGPLEVRNRSGLYLLLPLWTT